MILLLTVFSTSLSLPNVSEFCPEYFNSINLDAREVKEYFFKTIELTSDADILKCFPRSIDFFYSYVLQEFQSFLQNYNKENVEMNFLKVLHSFVNKIIYQPFLLAKFMEPNQNIVFT
ncbi:hypothetical protein SOMG_03569 [Schizosaccharomyces osmophilus]|uniref:Uncharacterized protein n=1 Tax=Schizosaccharomyces osmophilus TaxID=2545709 RepID=A0AAE9WE58_9SCHI|nr:uncharacterized protein SOMG_03569 [Schizosaccharomyces osmophilus]WBW74200.1 hypothetical protein SOMG_03569 [Schizosaccharomyces osmophilus]